jgi:enoyl-CoA hydratase/carnithine racemase
MPLQLRAPKRVCTSLCCHYSGNNNVNDNNNFKQIIIPIMRRSLNFQNSITLRTFSTRTTSTSTCTSNSTSICKRNKSTNNKPTTSNSSGSLVRFTNDATTKIGYITLNSPETYNALSVEMGQQFEALIHDLTMKLNDLNDYESNHDTSDSNSKSVDYNDNAKDNGIKNTRVIILKGSNQNFSSGGDLTWLRNLRHNPVHINADKMYGFYKSFLSIRSLPVPTIAHIEGYAIGAGACLALATDLRVMNETAKIGFNFVKLGIHSGMGGSHLLPNVIGESKSKLALLTGQVFNSKEAFHNGIAHAISNTNTDQQQGNQQGDQVTIDLAKQIAAMHPLAIRSMVQTTRLREDGRGCGLDATLRREAQAQALCYAKSDWGEGLDAVLERRQPHFGDYHDTSSDW